MNRAKKRLLIFSALPLCAFITTDSFAMEQDFSRKKLSEGCFLLVDQQQDQKNKHMLQFMQLSYPVQFVDNANLSAFGVHHCIVLSRVNDVRTLCNLATTSKSMRSYVTLYVNDSFNKAYISSQYLNSAMLHYQKIELRKEELQNRKSIEEKLLRRNIRMQLASARYDFGMALELYDIGEYGEAVSLSQKILNRQISRDQMMIDDFSDDVSDEDATVLLANLSFDGRK